MCSNCSLTHGGSSAVVKTLQSWDGTSQMVTKISSSLPNFLATPTRTRECERFWFMGSRVNFGGEQSTIKRLQNCNRASARAENILDSGEIPSALHRTKTSCRSHQRPKDRDADGRFEHVEFGPGEQRTPKFRGPMINGRPGMTDGAGGAAQSAMHRYDFLVQWKGSALLLVVAFVKNGLRRMQRLTGPH